MRFHLVGFHSDRDTISDSLTEMLRTGSQQLIYQAVQIELEALLAANTHRLTVDGKAAVVRNGYQPEREILTGIGPVSVKSPKVRSKDGEPICFHSSLVQRMYARVDRWKPPCPGFT
jgi:putative transposase